MYLTFHSYSCQTWSYDTFHTFVNSFVAIKKHLNIPKQHFCLTDDIVKSFLAVKTNTWTSLIKNFSVNIKKVFQLWHQKLLSDWLLVISASSFYKKDLYVLILVTHRDSCKCYSIKKLAHKTCGSVSQAIVPVVLMQDHPQTSVTLGHAMRSIILAS